MKETEGRLGAEASVRAAYARRAKKDYVWSRPAIVFEMQARERLVLDRLGRSGLLPLAHTRILDVGCGTGSWLRDFAKWGAEPSNVFGVELRAEPTAQARHNCPPGVSVQIASASALPFPDASFGLVLQATMFSSVLSGELRRAIAAEMMRVLRPDGLILWYDFFLDNPWNPDVRGVRRSEIRELFPGLRLSLRRACLAPPLTRALASRSWLLTHLLSRIPWLCTHYLGVFRRV